MTLSLKQLIERLQEQESANIPYQRTNVVEIERTGIEIRIITTEMEEQND